MDSRERRKVQRSLTGIVVLFFVCIFGLILGWQEFVTRPRQASIMESFQEGADVAIPMINSIHMATGTLTAVRMSGDSVQAILLVVPPLEATDASLSAASYPDSQGYMKAGMLYRFIESGVEHAGIIPYTFNWDEQEGVHIHLIDISLLHPE